MQTPGARDHEGTRTRQSLLERTNCRLVNGVTHPKIIGIDNQQSGLGWVTKELIGLGFHGHRVILHSLSLRLNENIVHIVWVATVSAFPDRGLLKCPRLPQKDVNRGDPAVHIVWVATVSAFPDRGFLNYPQLPQKKR